MVDLCDIMLIFYPYVDFVLSLSLSCHLKLNTLGV